MLGDILKETHHCHSIKIFAQSISLRMIDFSLHQSSRSLFCTQRNPLNVSLTGSIGAYGSSENEVVACRQRGKYSTIYQIQYNDFTVSHANYKKNGEGLDTKGH